MGKRVFVSYKHEDTAVQQIGPEGTCRDYVDTIIDRIKNVHVYKGEEADNDLSRFKDETIKSELRDRIFDSSVTLVLVSKGMREASLSEKDQWIPWEISYSLKEIERAGRTSRINGLLAIIIPDENGSYGHYFVPSDCPYCSDTVFHNREPLFGIIKNNMFNRKAKNLRNCSNPNHEAAIHNGDDYSYIHPVKWENFIQYPTIYINLAAALSERADEFDIQRVP